jgi:hypothetical protein
MKRSFNFTGNKKLDGCFIASFDEVQNPLVLKASIDSKSREVLEDLSPDYQVALAACDVLRFDYDIGTLGQILDAGGFTAVLKDFYTDGVKPQVDLRIVDLKTKKVEASAEDIIPETSAGQGRRSFVKLSVSNAIGKEIWRVRWSPTESMPVLQLNAEIPDVERKFTEASQLGTVVMPQVLRQILLIMLLSRYDEGSGVLKDSADIILAFCEKLEKSDPPALETRDYAEVSQWVDLVVSKFATKIDAASRFTQLPEPATAQTL